MGVKVDEFLYDYFSVNQLKDALSDIGVPAGKNKKQCVDKILEKWTAYNRGWYDLLIFLDTEDLENICDHFLIEYADWDDEESLMDKIEENRVLDFRRTPKKSVSKKSATKQSALNIQGNNINIGSNYKINSENPVKNNSDNVTKLNSDNTSIYDKLPKNQRIGLIIGIIGILATIGFGTYQMYESAMAEWNGKESSEPDMAEQRLAEILKSGDVDEFNKNKKDWVGELNFNGINLSKMDLTLVNLRDTSLQRANFDDSILVTAFFQGADLEQASFRNADLERATLVESNLYKAFLRSANFEQANLNRANMQDAILYNANLRSAHLLKTELQNADLQHAEFLWADLEDAKLDGALLNGTDFREAKNLPISSEEAKNRGAITDNE